MLQFTVEEINLISIYNQNTRAATVGEIAAALVHMDGDMRAIAESAVHKLNAMSEEEYAALSFDPADETDG